MLLSEHYYDPSSGLEGEGEAGEDGAAGVGVAEHGLVGLVQEVHAADEDLEPVGEAVAEAGLEVDVAAGDGVVAGAEVEVADVHGAQADGESAGGPVGARVCLVDRRSRIDGVHVQEAVVGVEGEGLARTPVGGELDALVGEGPDVAVLRLSVLTDNLDDVGTLGVEDAQFSVERSAEEMVAEGEVVAPGLLREEFGIGGSVHVEFAHVGHAEALGGGEFDGGVAAGHIGDAGLRDPLRAVGAVVVEAQAGVEHEFPEDLLVKDIDRLLVEFLMVGVDLGGGVAIGVAAVVNSVDAEGQGVAGEERDGLIGRQAGSVVSAVEEIRLRVLALKMAVIDRVVAEIVVEVDVTGGTVVLVLEGEGRHAADDVGPGVKHGGGDSAGILGIGLHEADAGAGLPGAAELVAELDHAVGVVVGGVLPVAVGAVMADGD